MTEEIHYVKADPSGNTTILVLDAVPKQEHASLAARLLQPECVGAEQVGFLTWPDKEADVRLDMMGGEFCGNASRSAAAYYCPGLDRIMASTYSCSGCNKILKAVVVRDEGELYDASIEVPLPRKMDIVSLADNDITYRFYQIELPGIMHFVHFTPSIKTIDKNALWRAVYQYASTRHYEAFGMNLVDRKTLTMIPSCVCGGHGYAVLGKKAVVPDRLPRQQHWLICAVIILPVKYASLVAALRLKRLMQTSRLNTSV